MAACRLSVSLHSSMRISSRVRSVRSIRTIIVVLPLSFFATNFAVLLMCPPPALGRQFGQPDANRFAAVKKLGIALCLLFAGLCGQRQIPARISGEIFDAPADLTQR